jgi:hypothetical protein
MARYSFCIIHFIISEAIFFCLKYLLHLWWVLFSKSMFGSTLTVSFNFKVETHNTLPDVCFLMLHKLVNIYQSCPSVETSWKEVLMTSQMLKKIMYCTYFFCVVINQNLYLIRWYEKNNISKKLVWKEQFEYLEPLPKFNNLFTAMTAVLLFTS